jgi:hypothetical protein
VILALAISGAKAETAGAWRLHGTLEGDARPLLCKASVVRRARHDQMEASLNVTFSRPNYSASFLYLRPAAWAAERELLAQGIVAAGVENDDVVSSRGTRETKSWTPAFAGGTQVLPAGIYSSRGYLFIVIRGLTGVPRA